MRHADDVGSWTDGAETSGEAVGASFAESPTGGHGIGSVETTGEAEGASFAESLAGGHDKLNLGEESGACSTISSVGGDTAVAPQQRPSSTGVAEVHESGDGSSTGDIVETTGEAVGVSSEAPAGGHVKLEFGKENDSDKAIGSVGADSTFAPLQRPAPTGVAELRGGDDCSITGILAGLGAAIQALHANQSPSSSTSKRVESVELGGVALFHMV